MSLTLSPDDYRAALAAVPTDDLLRSMHMLTHRIHDAEGGAATVLREQRAYAEAEIARRITEATDLARLAGNLLESAECQRPERSLRREWRRAVRTVRARIAALGAAS